jgi:hypothetical protein
MTYIPNAAIDARVQAKMEALKAVIATFESGGTYTRANYAGPSIYAGTPTPAIRTDGVTTGGTGGFVQGVDLDWIAKP